MNIKRKFVSTLLLTAAFCVSPAINVMAEDTTTVQTETLDSVIDNSSESEGQEVENAQETSTDGNESEGEAVNTSAPVDVAPDTENGETNITVTTEPVVEPEQSKSETEAQDVTVTPEENVENAAPWYAFSFKKLLMQLLVAMVIFVIPGCIIYYRAKH